MKKIFTIILSILCSVVILNAQSPKVYLKVGDSTRELTSSKRKIHKGDKLEFSVHANPFLYNITINAESIEYDFEIPEVIQKYLFDLEGVEALADTEYAAAIGDIFSDKSNDFTTSLYVLQKMDDLETALNLVVQKDDIDLSSLLQNKNEAILTIDSSFPCQVSEDCNLNLKLYLENALKTLERSLDWFASNPGKIDFDKIDFVKLMQIKADLDNGNFQSQIDALLKYYSAITPLAWYPSKSILSIKGDELKFEYELKQKKDLLITPIYADHKDSASFHINSGLKIDFSTGIVFSGLNNIEYSTSEVADSNGNTVNTVSIKNEKDFEIGVGGLIHVYKNSGSIRPTLSMGAMLNADQKVRYLLGGGLILGRKPRLIFNGGLALGRVERLSQNLSLGQVVASFDDVQLVDKNKTGWFLGLTYNF